MNLYNEFENRFIKHKNRTALVFQPRFRTIYWTYQDLIEKINTLSRLLIEKEVRSGDRVLLYSANSPYWVAAFFAILKRGAVVVPLNPQSHHEQLERIFIKVEPVLLLKSTRLAWSGKKILTLDIETAESKNETTVSDSDRPARTENDLAEIIFTSGTTGDPKGVMLTHENLLSNFNALSQAVHIKPKYHALNIVPLFHIYGQMISMLYPLGNGASVVYLPSLGSNVIRKTLNEDKVTHLIAVPELLKTLMLRIENELDQRRILPLLNSALFKSLPFKLRRMLSFPIRKNISKRLHTIACGGAPLDPAVEKKWYNLGFYVLQGYGLTETTSVATINTYRNHEFGTVGKPLSNVSIQLSSDQEILIKGFSVFSGYYKDQERTKEAFDGEWLKTDDGGKMDIRGFISVFGRKKYMILGPGGENVFPEDIEAELNKIEGVRDSAVVGIEEKGRTLIHAVLLSFNEDIEGIIEQANSRLAPHQQIQSGSIWPQADFPRSATRKVKKEEVITWLKSRKAEKTTVSQGTATPLIRLLGQITEHNPSMIHSKTKIIPELGLDSLLRIELVSRIDEEFGIVIEERLISPKTTVEELESHLKERMANPVKKQSFPYWEFSPFMQLFKQLTHLIIFPWLRYYVRFKITGLENLLGIKRPVIFMSNHLSYLDALALLYAIPFKFEHRMGISAAHDILYEKNKELVPLAATIFNAYPFATHEDENFRPSVEFTGKLIDNGFNVLVFPEGQLNRSNQKLLPLKGGTGLLAVEMQVPVVPIRLKNTNEIVPPDIKWFQKKGTVEVCFGKPLYFKETESYPEATKRIEEAMLTLFK